MYFNNESEKWPRRGEKIDKRNNGIQNSLLTYVVFLNIAYERNPKLLDTTLLENPISDLLMM